MSSRYAAISCALLLILSLFISGCRKKNEPTNPSEPFVEAKEMMVLATDSDEWYIATFALHMLYAEAVKVAIPAPYTIPTRSDATILHTLTYPSEERFITSDGYTFGMPSASITKAGQKTKYSVIGLNRRQIKEYDIPF